MCYTTFIVFESLIFVISNTHSSSTKCFLLDFIWLYKVLFIQIYHAFFKVTFVEVVHIYLIHIILKSLWFYLFQVEVNI